jgi:hypothetical protein
MLVEDRSVLARRELGARGARRDEAPISHLVHLPSAPSRVTRTIMVAWRVESGTVRAHRLLVRSLPLIALVPLFASAVACTSAPKDGDVGDDRAYLSSKLTSGCSASRAKILASASPARRAAIERGFTWLDDEVPYSQSASHEGFRTDCSGFVSMCWELSTSYTTASFIAGEAESSALDGYDDLLPGDALVHRSGGAGHIVLFLGWDDKAHSGACVLEQASTASDMQFRVRSTASLESGGYEPIRADALAEDTAPPETAKPKPVCVPGKAPDLCAAAAKDGVECGVISDGCTGELSCDAVLGGCEAGARCGARTANRCGRKASTAATEVVDTPAVDSDAADAKDSADTDTDADEKPSTKKKTSTNASPSAPQVAMGCSASGRGAGSDVPPLLALVLAASLVRRRSRTQGGAPPTA